MENQSLERAKAWVNNPYFDEEAKTEIRDLLEKNDTKEITERFYKDIEFGTGGIRSIIGMGINRINKYTIRKATQALANQLLTLPKEQNEGELRVALAYDSRRFSFEFAQQAAGVFAGNGIHAYIYKRLNPVPMLSFSVRHHKAHAGVMVTASHNPPEYNGYKVYWSDGCQVTEPNDKNVIAQYAAIEDFSSIKFMDFNEGLDSELIHWVGEDVENIYYENVKKLTINPDLCRDKGSQLKLVFTPIHGTGLLPCKQVLEQIGLSCQVVAEQALPDEKFPTVTSPNPENASALALAVALMKKTNSDLVFGTDPDTDRLGVAVWHEGEVHYPNGNQIGLLMLHYILSQSKKIPDNSYFIKTIVTTELQTTMAKKFGVKAENTLTGFKWICRRLREIEETDSSRNFLFGTEESFGYLNHDFIRDKDGVSSFALMAEVALWYKTQGMTLMQGLDKIYEEFGFSDETLLCIDLYGKEGAEKIARIMENFRNNSEKEMVGEEITHLEDYNNQTVVDFSTGKTEKLDFPVSNVLGFAFKSGNKLYLRPSGTEPKIKFYIMIQETQGSLAEKKQKAAKKTESFLSYIKGKCGEI